jgi:hypothetical protein
VSTEEQVSTDELLAQYVRNARERRSTATRGDAENRVESILTELQMPWRSEEADSWSIDSDVGEVRLGLNEDDEILSIWQLVSPVPGKPKRNAEMYRELLRINQQTLGAWRSTMSAARTGYW